MTTFEPRPTRRMLLCAALVTPVLGVVLAACGDPTDTEPVGTGAPPDESAPETTGAPHTIGHPTGADVAVFRLAYAGGFVPQEVAFVELPNLVVSGDGRVLRPGATTLEYPGTLVAPMTTRSIDEQGVQLLLAQADAAGLLAAPPDYSAELNIADAPNTVLTITTDSGTFVHSAYALGLTSDEGTEEATPARQTLLEFVNLLGDLETTVGSALLGDDVLLEPTEYRLRSYPISADDIAAIDPDPAIVDWPESAGLDLATAAECARVAAADVGTLFTDARSTTVFRQGDATFRLAVATVLPGDPAC